MARNFIILFEEKEGSSPIVRLLDNFDSVDVVRQVSNRGWEPLDLHCCGPIAMKDYLRCLQLIYGDEGDYMTKLNEVYTRTAPHPLAAFDKTRSVGLKMRFWPQRSNARLRWILTPWFRHASSRVFRTHGVVAFVTVRQDVFRWALSKYHGDGTGRPGHLQFKLASGKIDRAEVPKIKVDLQEFGHLLLHCEQAVAQKRRLIEHLNRRGVTTWPMFYESFRNDTRAFFGEILSRLDVTWSDSDISAALERGTRLQKVHSDNIHEFVINADEVLDQFGERYVAW
jgi:hypothetical protein